MVTWWKDRDKWRPQVHESPPHDKPEEQQDLPHEDIGDVAHDDSDDFDDVDLPDRGTDD
jgi:hypothetical protein